MWGLTPKLHIIDNDVSEYLKQYIEEIDTRFQIVPPHTHWRNAAEQAVGTSKNHFIAALCTVALTYISTYDTASYPN